MKKTLLLIFLLMLIPCVSFASELSAILDEQLEKSGIEELSGVLDDIQNGNRVVFDYDLKAIGSNILKGEWTWNIADIFKKLFAFYCEEFYAVLHILLGLVAVIIFSAFIENINRSLATNNTSDVMNLVCFLVLANIIIKVFYAVLGCAVLSTEDMSFFMRALFPMTLTLLATSGAPLSAGLFHPILMMSAEWTAIIVTRWLVPMICVSSAFSFCDALCPDFGVGRLASAFKKCVKWSLGILLTVFTGTVSICSLISPSVDKISVKTLKYATGNFIPIAGNLLSDTVDLILSCSSVIKNIVGGVGCVGILIIIAAPVLKMLVYMSVLYLSTVVAEPISSAKITKLLDSVLSLCSMFFVMTFVVGIMFIINIAVIMGAASWNM